MNKFKKAALSGLGLGVVFALCFLLAQVSTFSTLAQRPTAQPGGTWWCGSDALWCARYTGAAWAAFGPVFPLTEPPLTGWSNDNGGTFDVTNGYPFFDANSLATAVQIRAEYRTAPTAPYTCWALIYHSLGATYATNTSAWGMAFRDGTGKLISQTMYSDVPNNNGLWIERWNSSTSHNSDQTFFASTGSQYLILASRNPFWMFIEDDNTNLNFGYALDGPLSTHRVQVSAQGRLAFMGSGPTQVALVAKPTNAEQLMAVPSWSCK